MAAHKISQASAKMKAVAHQSVKDACIELFFFHITPEAELLHVKADGECCESECSALRSKFAGLGLNVMPITGTLPCIVAFSRIKNFLYLIEIAEDSASINEKRKHQLESMFASCDAHCVFVTAIQNRDLLEQEGADIAWGTIAWFAAEPSHMIHFGDT
jgi:BsuBI/PstI restriction endonuclease domain